MTKEIGDIIAAYRDAQKHGRRAALATVVHVEGSSYRSAGARMLIEDNGRMTGAISGGCLEGDALRKALQAINQQQNKLVTYNSLDEDDTSFGVQLGCNGIVHILFEPIDSRQPNHPIELLHNCALHRRDVVLVTLYSINRYHGEQPGTCFFTDGSQSLRSVANDGLEARVSSSATEALANKKSAIIEYDGYELTAFVELIEPPVSLVIAGCGNDAQPLVEMAAILGWQVTVIDGRPTHASSQRFPKAQHIIVGKPSEAMKKLSIDSKTVFVLMTHNYNYDMEMLGLLLHEKCTYIGTLGPRRRLDKMLAELEQNGIQAGTEENVIYGPVGLDIGAEAAEEIALSVLAEIKAVLAGRSGAFLKNSTAPIHARPAPVPGKTQVEC